MVIRCNGRRKTEAFLFVLDEAGAWTPLRLDDGTVSDGKVETYARCVESICGSADTFFTSVFCAQGKRQLSTYRNAEIKTLLADLLGQEEIRAIGQKAAETARLLKLGLTAIRQESADIDEQATRITVERQGLEGVSERVVQGLATRQMAQRKFDAARDRYSSLVAEREQARALEARRSQLLAERKTLIDAGTQAIAVLKAQDEGEQLRLERLEQRVANRLSQQRARRQALQQTQQQCRAVLASARAVGHAAARLPMAERVLSRRNAQHLVCRQQAQRLTQCQGAERVAARKLAEIEREAGKAALRAEELARRLGLTGEVPCAGSELQGQCKLLGDARDAQALLPSARGQIVRLAQERAEAHSELTAIRREAETLADAAQALAWAEQRCDRARSRASRLAGLAAKTGEMAQDAASRADATETDEERTERNQIETARRVLARQLEQQRLHFRAGLNRLDDSLAAMPAPCDDRQLVAASQALAQAGQAMAQAEQAHLSAVREAQQAEMLSDQVQALARRQGDAQSRMTRVEAELGGWNLFARCMSNDGLIALAIDDAGPALSGLTNDLLLACYAPRFTVSIHTLVETGKGEQKEGFDIVVHDGESGESKSVGLMSGGEKVWISCRARHEIHYADDLDMPSAAPSDQHRPCSCPPNTCNATRHKSAPSAAIDGNWDGGKSIRLMSGGERTWIEACLTRAIALYLAQSTGRRYGTLFADEADGPLDPDHKRMFMAMKREVLRLGGYKREFFITQTPELATMADAVIDMDAMHVDAHAAAEHAICVLRP